MASSSPIDGSAAAGVAGRAGGRRALEWWARAGLAARGLVYGIVGVLALQLALGDGGRATDQQGALREIAGQSFGTVLLVLVAVGLAGYASWSVVRAVTGEGVERSESKTDRISAAASAVSYAILVVVAISLLVGSGSGSGSSPRDTTAGVLGWPGGPVLVGIAGAVLIGVAIFQAVEGLGRRFMDEAKTGEMSEAVERGYTALGVAGRLARGVVFALIGYGLVKAALDYDAGNAVGLDGALRRLAQADYGPFVLGVVTVGLIAFGLSSLAEARYRRV